MSDKGPLSGRGKAAEEEWAHRQNREAIEKMKQKEKGGKKDGDEGCGCKDEKSGTCKDEKSGTCKDHDKTDPKDCCKKKKK